MRAKDAIAIVIAMNGYSLLLPHRSQDAIDRLLHKGMDIGSEGSFQVGSFRHASMSSMPRPARTSSNSGLKNIAPPRKMESIGIGASVAGVRSGGARSQGLASYGLR
jgi:hypothetical protein